MYNSCPFNATKYNSLCVTQPVTPVEPSGGVSFKRRRKKVFKTEFFDIIGTKLIFTLEEFNIIGFILIAEQLGIQISGETLHKVKSDLLLKGSVSYPFTTQQEILGFVKFKEEDYFDVKADGLMPSMQLQILKGTKLINVKKFQEIKGNKSIPMNEVNLIKGKKDISEILEALDLLNLEE